MPADERFVTRVYRPGDESAILDLFGRAFHARRSLDHFRWKYLQNPYGSGHITLTFDSSGTLVAHYAGYPVPVVAPGGEFLAHQIGDMMSDPSIRHIGRGLTSIFGRTALHFYTQFCEHKIAYNYGFNTATSRRFSELFLRADRVEPVTYRVREMPIPRIVKLQRWLRGYRLELVREMTGEYDQFFERVAPSYRFLVRRDARYLRWRYIECPDPGAFIIAIRKWRRLAGWSVFRVRENSLVWGDALFDPALSDSIEVMIRHVAPSYPVARVESWFPQRPQWFADALARIGFVAGAQPQDLSLMCVPFLLSDATQQMRDSLYYAMGDSDLF